MHKEHGRTRVFTDYTTVNNSRAGFEPTISGFVDVNLYASVLLNYTLFPFSSTILLYRQ